jgi:hypothetical protein
MAPTRERRVNRSENKQLAIQYFLQSCILRLGLRGLVLGTRDGLLVAAAGGGVDSESAAAFAPFVFHEAWDFPESVEEAFFVDAIPLAHTTLYLFVVGRSDQRSPTVSRTKSGIRRILDE